MKNVVLRELYVARHGQSSKFRAVKWVVILCIVAFIYRFHGWSGVAYFVMTGALLGTSLHFFLRYKTKGWRKPWGPVKKRIKTPYD